MVNFRYQVITAKGESRQVLYVAGSRNDALEYVGFLLGRRDLNEPLEYIIKPVTFISDDAYPAPKTGKEAKS